MKKEPEVSLQAPFLDYNSWLNIYDVYQFYYNTEYGFITLLMVYFILVSIVIQL